MDGPPPAAAWGWDDTLWRASGSNEPTPLSPILAAIPPAASVASRIVRAPQSNPLCTGLIFTPSPRICEVATNGLRGEIGGWGVDPVHPEPFPSPAGVILHPGSGISVRVALAGGTGQY